MEIAQLIEVRAAKATGNSAKLMQLEKPEVKAKVNSFNSTFNSLSFTNPHSQMNAYQAKKRNQYATHTQN